MVRSLALLKSSLLHHDLTAGLEKTLPMLTVMWEDGGTFHSHRRLPNRKMTVGVMSQPKRDSLLQLRSLHPAVWGSRFLCLYGRMESAGREGSGVVPSYG